MVPRLGLGRRESSGEMTAVQADGAAAMGLQVPAWAQSRSAPRSFAEGASEGARPHAEDGSWGGCWSWPVACWCLAALCSRVSVFRL